MALDFPANPTNGQVYDSYIYNSTVGAWQAREDSATVATISTVLPASANPGDIWYDNDDGTSYIYYDDGTSAQWVELLSSGLPLLNTKADLAGATFTGNVTAPRFISNVATGTSPLTVTSTTAVANLNADLLDGNHSTAFAPAAGSTNITTLGTITSGTWNGSVVGVQYGGTGANTLTSGGYLKGAGTGPITSQSGIPAGDITSGTISYSRLPAGIIRQVVYGSTGTQVTSSTNASWTDTGLTATITPTSSTSKILIILNQNGITKQTSANIESALQLKLLKNGVEFATWPGNLIGYSPSAGYLAELGVGYTLLDSPATTSALTYKTQFKNYVNASFVSVQHYGGTSSITLMEILQ
jgi:hypothetical protein